jgi:hypothetical protein
MEPYRGPTIKLGSITLKSKEEVPQEVSPVIDTSQIDPNAFMPPPEIPGEQLTGEMIAAEFAAERRKADEGICQDALTYLQAGYSEQFVIEIIRLRRGADYGVTEAKIQAAVKTAAELLKQKRKK